MVQPEECREGPPRGSSETPILEQERHDVRREKPPRNLCPAVKYHRLPTRPVGHQPNVARVVEYPQISIRGLTLRCMPARKHPCRCRGERKVGQCYALRSPIRWLIACRFIHIHLLNLLDGSPYRTHHSNSIAWAFPPGTREVRVRHLALTGSRLAMCVCLYLPLAVRICRVIAWDWKTGDLVRLARLWLRFPHITLSGFRLFERKWEWIDQMGLSGFLP